MTATIPAGWTITRREHGWIDVTDPHGLSDTIYGDEGAAGYQLLYRLASALLSATPASPQPPAEAQPVNAEMLAALRQCVAALDALHAPGDSIYTRASDAADRAIARAHGVTGDDQ
jgi:hypothetical protein